MKLEHLISEQNIEPEYDKATDLIIQNCQPFLREINYDVVSNCLYRGYNPRPQDADAFKQGLMIKKRTRQDRKPVDMPPPVAEMMDQMFVEHFGYKFRTQSIFTIGSWLSAKGYGNVYVVFPIGNFQYLWDQNNSDLFEGDLMDLIEDYLNIKSSTGQHSKEHYEAIVKYIKSNMSQQNLSRALSLAHEVMIGTDYYYMIPMRHRNTNVGNELLERLQKRLKDQ